LVDQNAQLIAPQRRAQQVVGVRDLAQIDAALQRIDGQRLGFARANTHLVEQRS
jgi:hypothetical protein